MKYIKVIVRSQVNIIVQPISAESCDFPAGIAAECQSFANCDSLPVVLLGARGDAHTFYPEGKKVLNIRNHQHQH